MAKRTATTRTSTRTARHAAAAGDGPEGLSDAPGTVSDVSPAGSNKAREAEEKDRQRAAHTTTQPIPQAENPPRQPEMIPAKQVHAQTVGGPPAVDPDELGQPRRDRSKRIRVQATALGYYDDVLRRVDDVFDIFDEKEFSKKWMRRVPTTTPTVVTGSNVALRKGAAANEPTEGDPLGAGD